jgi:hypothetical protein
MSGIKGFKQLFRVLKFVLPKLIRKRLSGFPAACSLRLLRTLLTSLGLTGKDAPAGFNDRSQAAA